MTLPDLRTAAARCLLALATLLVLPALAAAQTGAIAGRVVDAATRNALAGAVVTVEGTQLRAATGPDGAFRLGNVPAGTATVRVSYLGFEDYTGPAAVVENTTLALSIPMTANAIVLDALVVEGRAVGQAQALNQQRAAQNTVSIVSSDFSGQFPDKTIADAVRRLPGITVETDRDTGGSEGRYVTIRGMNADFNAITINGVRVTIADFGGASRAVPLDVVSARSAESIAVTKALLPSQDADGIGGAVDIRTRTPSPEEGRTASIEAQIGWRAMLEDYDNYPYGNPTYEAAASYGDVFGENNAWSALVAVNLRDNAFVKQRVSTTGWSDVGSTSASYVPAGLVLQHFFDDVSSTGASAALAYRPSETSSVRLDLAYNVRETDRGRQRLVVGTSSGSFVGTPVVDGDTVVSGTRSGNRAQREVRDFGETQSNLSLALTGEHALGTGTTLTWLAGWNRGEFEGDQSRDILARFRTLTGNATWAITPGDAWNPAFSFSRNLNDPLNFRFDRVDRGSRDVTDDNFTLGTDLRQELATSFPSFLQAGVRARLNRRDLTSQELAYYRSGLDPSFGISESSWTIGSAVGGLGSSVADYRANSTLGGYDFGFFVDPVILRRQVDEAVRLGLLETDPVSNAARALARSYEADEDIYAAYLMGQATFGDLTLLAGFRVERTEIGFTGHNADGDGIIFYSATPYSADNAYTDFTPGVHLRYDFTPRLIGRVALTRSLARATYANLNPTRELNDFDEIVTEGNLDLDPVQSNNLDISLEYYLSEIGIASIGVFAKDMRNNIYTEVRTIGAGDGYPSNVVGWTLERPRNAQGAEVYGVELAWEQNLAFLPGPFDGLGFGINYTYTDSEVDFGDLYPDLAGRDVPLFDQVGDVLNASLFYDKHGLRVRASLAFRSEAVFELDADDFALSRTYAASTVFDLTASYRVTDTITVFAEFQNITDEPNRAFNGDEDRRLDYEERTDWSGALGLRFTL